MTSFCAQLGESPFSGLLKSPVHSVKYIDVWGERVEKLGGHWGGQVFEGRPEVGRGGLGGWSPSNRRTLFHREMRTVCR